MKILITGGTGFIGHQLCKNLLDHGHTVTVLSRRPEIVPSLCGQQVTAINSLSSLTPDQHFEVLINLAGEPIADARWTAARKQALWDSRITVTEQLMEYIAGAEKRPRALISGSAIGYYGDQENKLLDEDSEFADDFGHQLCAAWEQAAMKAAQYGVRVCIVRTGLVIGKNGGFLKRMLLPFKLGLGGRIGDGKQWMSWVHRNDLIAMIEHLANTPQAHGIYNGTAPNPVTNEEFTQCLATVLKRRAKLPMPAFPLKLLMGEMSTLLLGGQRVLPKRFQAEKFKFEFENLEQALNDVLT